MGDRRMLSNAIIDTDAFLSLPITAQMLYVRINQSCDDWGATSQVWIAMQKARATEEDLQKLIDKRFILKFDEVYIVKHWFISNKIRKDRLKGSNYKEIIDKLYIKENGAYTADKDALLSTNCQPNDNQKATKNAQNDALTKPNLTKPNLTKNNKLSNDNLIAPPTQKEIIDYVKDKGYSVDPVIFYEYYAGNDWKDKNGKPVKNWKLKLLNWQKHEPPKKQVYTLDEMDVQQADINAIRKRLFRKEA